MSSVFSRTKYGLNSKFRKVHKKHVGILQVTQMTKICKNVLFVENHVQLVKVNYWVTISYGAKINKIIIIESWSTKHSRIVHLTMFK